MTKKDTTTFRSLDLVKAAAFGWLSHRSLNGSEYQVLQFIALRGRSTEPGMAFAWYPIGGQEWWADMMAMSHSNIRKSLHTLRKKGLVENLSGSALDSRFSRLQGYGIPEWVLAECREWYKARQDMVYTKVPNTPAEISPTPSDCYPAEQDCYPAEHRCYSGNTRNALTRGFATHTHRNTQVETQLLTDTDSPSGSRSTESGDSMRYEDEWSVPKDERPMPRRQETDDFDVPREAKESPETYRRPSSRVMDVFWDLWVESREKRTNLAVPWSTKMIAQRQFNILLKKYPEPELTEMVRIFFRQIDAGQIALKSTDLWKDFLYHQGRLYQILKSTKPVSQEQDVEAELERFKRMIAK